MTEVVTYISESLEPYYSPEEIRSLTSLILEHVTQRPPYLQLINKDSQLSPTEEQSVREIVERLRFYEPIQYIIGETLFYNMPFQVNQSVLIPRPETEELVDLIVKSHKGVPCRILDIGTGSGCIAVSLATALKGSTVKAIDISPEAIAVARINARNNGTDITLIQGDILTPDDTMCQQIGTIDILVSNPPYVTVKEKSGMQPHVLNHEPHTALFVPDEDPLLFYRAIAAIGKQILSPAGKIYFEINQHYGKEVQQMLQEEGYASAGLRNDMFGHLRFIIAEL